MKLSLENKLAIKITLISVLIISLILGGVMFLQYQFVQRDTQAFFEKDSKNYEKNIIASKVLSGNVLEKVQESDGNGIYDGAISDLLQSIVLDDKNNIILNQYYPELTPQDKELFLSIPDRVVTRLDIGGYHILAYKFSSGGYTVINSQYVSNPVEYYQELLKYFLILGGVILIILYAVSMYFARLSIRPIREHNAALESYNRNLAHELRTPLAVIRGDLDMLELTQDHKFIESSREEVSSMERIIDGLLFLAKPKTDHENLKEYNITTETRDLLDRYTDGEVEFTASRANIQKSIDPELYRRLLMNLISNALRYRSNSGVEVKLTEDRLSVSNRVEKNLSKKELSKLTELFYQADTSRHSEGYGLGLAMVKKICEMFEWRLKITCRDHIFSVNIDTSSR